MFCSNGNQMKNMPGQKCLSPAKLQMKWFNQQENVAKTETLTTPFLGGDAGALGDHWRWWGWGGGDKEVPLRNEWGLQQGLGRFCQREGSSRKHAGCCWAPLSSYPFLTFKKWNFSMRSGATWWGGGEGAGALGMSSTTASGQDKSLIL